MKSWKQKILIDIAGRHYPLTVNSEDEEECLRRAGKLINDKWLQHKQSFRDKDVQDLLAIIALQLATKLIELDTKANSTEQVDRLKQIYEQLEAFVNQCHNC